MSHTIFKDKPNYKQYFFYSLVVFVSLQAIDLVTTLYGLRHGGAEANDHVLTLAAYLNSIPAAVVIDKIVCAGVFVWLYFTLVERNGTSYLACIAAYSALNLFYLVVVLNNVAVILISQ